MILYSKNGKERCTVIRENMLKKIAQIKEELAVGGRSTYSMDVLKRSLAQEEKNLQNLDEHGDIKMIEQMVFEHQITQA